MFFDDLARGMAAAQCLDAGLLGGGVPLFRRPGGTRIPLDQVTVAQTPVPTSWVRIRR